MESFCRLSQTLWSIYFFLRGWDLSAISQHRSMRREGKHSQHKRQHYSPADLCYILLWMEYWKTQHRGQDYFSSLITEPFVPEVHGVWWDSLQMRWSWLWSIELVLKSPTSQLDISSALWASLAFGTSLFKTMDQTGIKSVSVQHRGLTCVKENPLVSPFASCSPRRDERCLCCVIRCISVSEGSSDRLQEAAFTPDDEDHRKQKCLFVPPQPRNVHYLKGPISNSPLIIPNTHSWVRSGGILHERTDK